MGKALTAGIHFRVSTVDVRRLKKLARHYEMSGSALLRRIIGDASKAAGLEGSPSKGK